MQSYASITKMRRSLHTTTIAKEKEEKCSHPFMVFDMCSRITFVAKARITFFGVLFVAVIRTQRKTIQPKSLSMRKIVSSILHINDHVQPLLSLFLRLEPNKRNCPWLCQKNLYFIVGYESRYDNLKSFWSHGQYWRSLSLSLNEERNKISYFPPFFQKKNEIKN